MNVVEKKHKHYLEGIIIKHFVTRNSEIKMGYVERLIKTLRSRLSKIMLHNHMHTWIDQLQNITSAYNNSIHSGLGMKPIAAMSLCALTMTYHYIPLA